MGGKDTKKNNVVALYSHLLFFSYKKFFFTIVLLYLTLF